VPEPSLGISNVLNDVLVSGLPSLVGVIFNNFHIANCAQDVPVIKFENRSIFGEDTDNEEVGHSVLSING